MFDLAAVGRLLAEFAQYEEDNRVDRWERLNVLVQEQLDGLNVQVCFEDEGSPVMSYRTRAAARKEDAVDFWAFQEWVYAHDSDLFSVLGRKRFVLFGEWVGGLQRGVHYSGLPSPFLAIDVYDLELHRFLSYDLMVEVLRATVPTVLVLWRSLPPPPFPAPTPSKATRGAHFDGLKKQIKLPEALKRKSAFGDEPVEGLYIRIERGGETNSYYRFKLKRQVDGADERGPKTNVVLAPPSVADVTEKEE